MDPEFWQKRWDRDQIGFHLDQVNPYLMDYWSGLGLPDGARVMVPLCGKTLDLVWLARQGHAVLGVEKVEKAVKDFFAEQDLQPEVDTLGRFARYRAAGIELLCGDIFDLRPEDVAGCQGLYDRAALIALPEDLRGRYVEHLATILPTRLDGLLITLDYDPGTLQGPPFAVGDDEVRARFAAPFTVELLASPDVLADNWKFLERGVKRLDERVYRLKRQAAPA